VLDLRTGEILTWSGAYSDSEEIDAVTDPIDAEPDRYVEIEAPDSSEQWQWMADFAATVGNSGIRELLEVALDGKGAFRRFRNVLAGRPEEACWFAQRAARVHEAIDVPSSVAMGRDA